MNYQKLNTFPSNYVILDFETTGFDPFQNEPIQIAAVRYEQFIEKERFVSYIKPIKPIPPFITELTGITNDDVNNAQPVEEVLEKLIYFLKTDPIVAHNASFDMKFLLVNMQKCNIPFKRFSVVDTLTLARKYIPTTNHKLPTLKIS